MLDQFTQKGYIKSGAQALQKNALNLHEGCPAGSFPLLYIGTSTKVSAPSGLGVFCLSNGLNNRRIYMAKLKVYTKSFCPYCVRARSILSSVGINEFEEISIDGQEQVMRQKLYELTDGRWDVPQAFVGNQYIGDDDDLARLAQSGELVEMLKTT